MDGISRAGKMYPYEQIAIEVCNEIEYFRNIVDEDSLIREIESYGVKVSYKDLSVYESRQIEVGGVLYSEEQNSWGVPKITLNTNKTTTNERIFAAVDLFSGLVIEGWRAGRDFFLTPRNSVIVSHTQSITRSSIVASEILLPLREFEMSEKGFNDVFKMLPKRVRDNMMRRELMEAYNLSNQAYTLTLKRARRDLSVR